MTEEMRNVLEADPEIPVKDDSLRDRDEGAIGGDAHGGPVVPDPAPLVVVGGKWQCLAPKGCEGAMKRVPFNGPTQTEVRDSGEPIVCPECGNINVIFAGERREKAQEETRT